MIIIIIYCFLIRHCLKIWCCGSIISLSKYITLAKLLELVSTFSFNHLCVYYMLTLMSCIMFILH